MWQVYCWASLSKEQNKDQLFGTTTRSYMQSKIIAAIEHATRQTDLFRTTRQQKAQRLILKAEETQTYCFWTPVCFRFTFVHLFVNIFRHVCYLVENFREYFQLSIPVHRLRNQITWRVVSNFDARGLRTPICQCFTLPSLRVVKPTAKCTCICVTDTRLKSFVLCCSLQSPFSLRSALLPCLVLRQQLSLIKCVRTFWEHMVLLWRWSNGTSISVAVCLACCYLEQLLKSSGKMNSGFVSREPSEPHFASSFSE